MALIKWANKQSTRHIEHLRNHHLAGGGGEGRELRRAIDLIHLAQNGNPRRYSTSFNNGRCDINRAAGISRKSFSPNPGWANGTVPSRDSDFWSDSEMFSLHPSRPRVPRVDASRWKRRVASPRIYVPRAEYALPLQNREHEWRSAGSDFTPRAVLPRRDVPVPRRRAFLRATSAECLTISTGISLGESFGFVSAFFKEFV